MTRLRKLLVREGLTSGALDATPLADAYPAISYLSDHAIGADFKAIPERVLRAKAKAAGKAVHSEWKSPADVAQYFSRLSAQVQRSLDLELFRRGLEEAEDVQSARERLSQWLVGDLTALNLMERHYQKAYPLMYQVIGVDRNKAWVPRTADIMRRTHSTFVCIGIAHLLGPASVLEFLKQDGVRVGRVA